jgi:hypothetical protein
MTAPYLGPERTRAEGKPLFLYRFDDTVGSFGIGPWHYTSAEHHVYDSDGTVAGLAQFEPLEGIWHEMIESGTDLARRSLRVHLPTNSTLATELRTVGMLQRRIRLDLFRLQRGAAFAFDAPAQWAKIYRGEIAAAEARGHETVLTVTAHASRLRRRLPVKVFQPLCNNFLYDAHCGADINFFRRFATVDAVNGRVVTVTWNPTDIAPGGGNEFNPPYPVGAFTGGVLFGNRAFIDMGAGEVEREFIELDTGDGLTSNLKLIQPVPWLALTQQIQVVFGCDRSRTTCEDKFNNLARFMGFDKATSIHPSIEGVGGDEGPYGTLP